MVALMDPSDMETVGVISFHSKRVRRVGRSTFAVELLNQLTCLDTVMFVKAMAMEVFGQELDTHLRCDALSVVKHVHSLRQQPTERRLSADIDAIREALQENVLTTFEHVPGRYNVSDGLTKGGHNLKASILLAMEGKWFVPETDCLRSGKRRPRVAELL